MLITACNNDDKWVDQHNTFHKQWETSMEAGYTLTGVYINPAGQAWAINSAGIILYRNTNGEWIKDSLPIKGARLLCIGGRQDEVWVAGDNGMILYKKLNAPWMLEKNDAGNARLNAIFATPDDVWITGSNGTILHKKGNGPWIQEKSPDGQDNLTKIKGTADNLYILGRAGIILHKTGKADWIKEDCPSKNKALINLFIQNNDVWVCGDSGLILHKTGNGPWLTERTPANTGMLLGIYGWDDHIWAVDISGTILCKKDDAAAWSIEQQNNNHAFSGIYGHHHDLWVAVYNGGILHKHEYDPWKQEPTLAKDILLLQLAGNEKQIIAVGENETILTRKENGVWENENRSMSQASYTGVYTQDNEIWISGSNGTILYKKGNSKWMQEFTGITDFKLKDGYRYQKDVWLMGKDGTILHNSDGKWQKVETVHLPVAKCYDMYGYKDDIWIAGINTFLHKKSGQSVWKQEYEKNGSFDIFSFYGNDDDLWAVGKDAVILHKKAGDNLWLREKIDQDEIGNLQDVHLHSIVQQGNDLWSVGHPDIILHKQGNLPWKRAIIYDQEVHFSKIIADRNNIWAIGIKSDGNSIIFQKAANKHWKAKEIGGDYITNIMNQKGLYFITSSGFLYKENDSAGFVVMKEIDQSREGLIGATMVDKKLYFIRNNSIASVTTGTRQYPIVSKIKWSAMAGIVPDSVELQIVIQLPPKDKAIPAKSIKLSLQAKPYSLKQQKEDQFKNVPARYKIIDSSDNSFTIAARFEIFENYHIIPGLEAYNKLMVKVNLSSESENFFEEFILRDANGNEYLTVSRYLLKPWIINLSVASTLLIYLILLTIWFFSPLYFYKLHQFLIDKKLPFPFAALIKVSKILLLESLIYSNRVQNAWLRANKDELIDYFTHCDLVGARKYYVPLPLTIKDTLTEEIIERPNNKLLNRFFDSKQTVVQITGQGGTGKTTLAVMLAQWLVRDAVTNPKTAKIPIIIENDTDNILQTVTGIIKAQLNMSVVSERFIISLLEKQRLVIILDALSEKTAATQEYVRNIHRHIPVNALLITSRHVIDMQVKRNIQCHLFALNNENLVHFITSYLAYCSDHPFKRGRDQLAFAQRIVELVEDANETVGITPILVKLIIDNAILNHAESCDVETIINGIPDYIPQVYYQYLTRVNPTNASASNLLNDYEMVEVVEVMARLSLQKSFIPRDFPEDAVKTILESDKHLSVANAVQRLIDNGIIRRQYISGAFYLRFNLDTLAEYVGASRLYDEYQHDAVKLQALIQTIDQLGREADGFRQAFERVKAYKAKFCHV